MTTTISPILYEADFAPSLFAPDPAALDPAADLLTAVDWNEVLAALDVMGAPAIEMMPVAEYAAPEIDAGELLVEVLELDATLLEPEPVDDAGAWVFEVAVEPEAWAEDLTPLDVEAALPHPEELASVDDMLLLEAALADLMGKGGALDAVVARTEAQRREMWIRREAAGEIMVKPVPTVDCDVSVPLDKVSTFLERIDARFREGLDEWRRAGFAPVRREWLARAAGIGERIRVQLPDGTLLGVLKDLDPAGALVVDCDGAERRITAGSILRI